MRILVGQINPTIGDLKKNTERIIQTIEYGQSQNCDLVIFPEMALTGYPPEDFILLPHFMDSVEEQLKIIVQSTKEIAAIVGLPRISKEKQGKNLYNSAALISNQHIEGYADKILLPTYDIFDERRYFEPGKEVKIWDLKGKKIAITICEDIWEHAKHLTHSHYQRDPILEISSHPLACMINLSASPYSTTKWAKRLDTCLKASRSLDCPLLLCNQVGGNDSLIFDGRSLYVNPEGVLQCAKGFEEDMMVVDLKKRQAPFSIRSNQYEELYLALVLGVRDYFHKSGFKKGCLGLSGGIDSALVACIAAEAIGPGSILALSMPSRYSSSESRRDAALLAKHLAIEYKEISIEAPFESFLCSLAPAFEGYPCDVTEENLQARIRGVLLMAFSNKMGYLVLSTGNKSELALGYSTLYGDMCGSLAVIGDVSKQQVYALARWINREKEIIPFYTIERPPSAELKPNQKDSDTLPDYAIIDHIVNAYVEEQNSPLEIAKTYHLPFELVQNIIARIHKNEYKRRQAPPVLRVSEKAFSVGRKFPIVQKWIS